MLTPNGLPNGPDLGGRHGSQDETIDRGRWDRRLERTDTTSVRHNQAPCHLLVRSSGRNRRSHRHCNFPGPSPWSPSAVGVRASAADTFDDQVSRPGILYRTAQCPAEPPAYGHPERSGTGASPPLCCRDGTPAARHTPSLRGCTRCTHRRYARHSSFTRANWRVAIHHRFLRAHPDVCWLLHRETQSLTLKLTITAWDRPEKSARPSGHTFPPVDSARSRIPFTDT